jgi:plastocyanin
MIRKNLLSAWWNDANGMQRRPIGLLSVLLAVLLTLTACAQAPSVQDVEEALPSPVEEALPSPVEEVLPSPAAEEASPAASPSPEEEEGETMQLGEFTFNVHGTADVQGQDMIEMEADSFYFEPTFLRGNPGQSLQIEVRNASSTLHNFSLDQQQIDQDIQPNGQATVEVTFPDSGVVRFYCKYHVSQGMNGELLADGAEPQAP